MRKTIYTIALTISALLALSACGALDLTPESKSNEAAAPADEGAAEGTTADGTTADPESTATTGTTARPLVKAVQATIGTIVTTGRDLPLYRWDKDNPGTSTCYDTCAEKFTAYPYTEDLAFEGVARKLVGKVQRKDGTWQLTLNRQPVYTHVNDEAGTWKAQGQNGAWWLISPDGGKLVAKK
jgi:predicted lipoprotein with Yx(FWY)xxD motif